MSRRPSPYARSISGLLAGLAATGTLGYFTARGISGPPPTQSAQAPQRAGTGAAAGALQAAAAGDNGADFGFTGYCGVERHAVKDLLEAKINYIEGDKEAIVAQEAEATRSMAAAMWTNTATTPAQQALDELGKAKPDIAKAITNLVRWSNNLIFFTTSYTHSLYASEKHSVDPLRVTTKTQRQWRAKMTVTIGSQASIFRARGGKEQRRHRVGR